MTTPIVHTKYNNEEFNEKLFFSRDFENPVIEEIKLKFPSDRYDIIEQFDNDERGILSLQELQQEHFTEELAILKNILRILYTTTDKKDRNGNIISKTRTIEEVNARINSTLKNGIRGHDIAVIDKKTNNIVCLVECKDFAQFAIYDKTGLPEVYLKKINLIRKILEKKQDNNKIVQLVTFRDNQDLVNTLVDPDKMKKMYRDPLSESQIEDKIVKNKDDGSFPAYFGILDNLFLSEISALTNKSGNYVKSRFIKWKFQTDKNSKQLCWDIPNNNNNNNNSNKLLEMTLLSDLDFPTIQSESIVRENIYIENINKSNSLNVDNINIEKPEYDNNSFCKENSRKNI